MKSGRRQTVWLAKILKATCLFSPVCVLIDYLWKGPSPGIVKCREVRLTGLGSKQQQPGQRAAVGASNCLLVTLFAWFLWRPGAISPSYVVIFHRLWLWGAGRGGWAPFSRDGRDTDREIFAPPLLCSPALLGSHLLSAISNIGGRIEHLHQSYAVLYTKYVL